MKIRVTRMKPGAYLPERAHYNDAGADVRTPERVMLHKGEVTKIPLGIGVDIPDGYAGYLLPKTGLTSKGLITQMCPIDSGYTGEIHALVLNVSGEFKVMDPGEKVGQLVIMPCILADFQTEALGKERGTGAFGSTGK